MVSKGNSQGCPWGPWPRRWIVSPTEIGHMGDAFHSATWNQRGLWGPEGDMWCLEESQIQNANLEGHGIQAVAGWGRPGKHEVRTPIVKRQDWGQEATKRTEKDRPEGQKQFPMANKKPRNENVLKGNGLVKLCRTAQWVVGKVFTGLSNYEVTHEKVKKLPRAQ